MTKTKVKKYKSRDYVVMQVSETRAAREVFRSQREADCIAYIAERTSKRALKQERDWVKKCGGEFKLPGYSIVRRPVKRAGLHRRLDGRWVATNVVFYENNISAYSYSWWKFVDRIKVAGSRGGYKTVFNNYTYSKATSKHQSKVLGLMRELGIRIDAVIKTPKSLSSPDAYKSALQFHLARIAELKLKKSHAREGLNRRDRGLMRDHVKAISFLATLGLKATHEMQEAADEAARESRVARLERLKRRKREREAERLRRESEIARRRLELVSAPDARDAQIQESAVQS